MEALSTTTTSVPTGDIASMALRVRLRNGSEFQLTVMTVHPERYCFGLRDRRAAATVVPDARTNRAFATPAMLLILVTRVLQLRLHSSRRQSAAFAPSPLSQLVPFLANRSGCEPSTAE